MHACMYMYIHACMYMYTHSVCFYLDQCSHDSQAGESQVLKRSGLAHRVEEGIQEQRYVCCGHKQHTSQGKL